MSREVEVFRIIDVSAQTEEPAEAAPETRYVEAGNGAHHALGLWTTRDGAHDLVVQDANSTIGVEHVAFPEPLDARLAILGEPDSERARGYRLLRHRLFSDGDPRIVAITSATPGEGKTTCAFNLALAMAEDTMTRVLLVDANLRRPALGRILKYSPCESLVANISRSMGAEPPYPVASIFGTRLHVAALPEKPLEGGRLDRTLFAVALGDLRGVYDYIVVDAASVLESGDVDVVGECSSGVLVTARAGRSRARDMRRAIEQLAPARVLGCVLIDA